MNQPFGGDIVKLSSLISVLFLGVAIATTATAADPYPTKPIRLIVPFAPGGSTDIIARAISDPLGRILGQPVIVENKAGGGGSIGALEVVRAAKDGHVIGMATVSTTAANPAINKKIGYDPIKDLQPITNIAATPNVIAVHPSFPARDYKTFIELLKKNPGKYSYSSSGTGGIGHLQTELFKNLSGTFIVHIPYRGAGPALVDTVAGQVPMIFDNLPSALPFIKDGKLIPIVIAAPKRLAFMPNVPTFAEVGLAPVNRMAYYGLTGPAGMPKEVAEKIYLAVQKALQDPAVRKRIEDTGSFIVNNSPDQFAAEIKAEYDIYKDVVIKQNLSLN
jgi:tripartite-type tricarboxylate transporter receptor subunit TctC